MNYDEALQRLYAAPHEAFVAERKRLAAELKRSGDKPGATRLAELTRPTLSAWVVNQLFRQALPDFEELFASTRRVRSGELAAAVDARECTLRLKKRAASILDSAGHAVTEATLRRVTTNLAALAAAGSFEPDPPGAFSADREPPGFDATALLAWSDHAPTAAAPRPKAEHRQAALDQNRARSAAEARARAERERLEAEAQARQRAEHERLTAALTAAHQECASRGGKVELLRAELREAEAALAVATENAGTLERQLQQLASDAAAASPHGSQRRRESRERR